MDIIYRTLPRGTKVTLVFDHTSSNCISSPVVSWTDTVQDDGDYRKSASPVAMLTVPGYDFVDSCYSKNSWASWNVTVVTPSGVKGTANIRIVAVPYHRRSSAQNYAIVECHFPDENLPCHGSDSSGSETVRPGLWLGPMRVAATPPGGQQTLLARLGGAAQR